MTLMSVEPDPQMRLVVGEPVLGRTQVTLSGSLDLAVTDELDARLRAAMTEGRPRPLALDLSAVDFCDCAALRVLSGAHAQGRRLGCTVLITAASPAVTWLLELVGSERLPGSSPPEPAGG
jgi:anti-anti-sigma factor